LAANPLLQGAGVSGLGRVRTPPPDEWDKNPTEWLSNYDINSIMKQYDQFYPEFTFIGSTTMDFDEKPTDYDGDCVCNNM
jgi:hypothetical protein